VNDHLDEFAAEETARERARIEGIAAKFERFAPVGSHTKPDRWDQQAALRAAFILGAAWMWKHWAGEDPTRAVIEDAAAHARTIYPG